MTKCNQRVKYKGKMAKKYKQWYYTVYMNKGQKKLLKKGYMNKGSQNACNWTTIKYVTHG